MIGTGTIHRDEVKEVAFLTQQEYDELPKRDWGYPTGRRIGRQWLLNVSGTYILCEWVEKNGLIWMDINHVCIIEWNK